MGKLPSLIIGLMFFQRNHTVLDMRQGILNFHFFSMQLKTADHKNSNVMEPILNPDNVMIPSNDGTIVPIQSQIYAENAVTGILQPSELLNEENDIKFCAAKVTLTKGTTRIHVKNFSDQSYKLKKGIHIANFSVMTPEQMKHVRPIDHMANQANQCPPGIYATRTKKMLFVLLAAFLKPTGTTTNTNNFGFRHLRNQGTKRPTRQY